MRVCFAADDKASSLVHVCVQDGTEQQTYTHGALQSYALAVHIPTGQVPWPPPVLRPPHELDLGATPRPRALRREHSAKARRGVHEHAHLRALQAGRRRVCAGVLTDVAQLAQVRAQRERLRDRRLQGCA
jgi:hypothetical protein